MRWSRYPQLESTNEVTRAPLTNARFQLELRSEGRQGASHRAQSHSRHPEEPGLAAEPQDGGPELGRQESGHRL
jgi:hypothetical protein